MGSSGLFFHTHFSLEAEDSHPGTTALATFSQESSLLGPRYITEVLSSDHGPVSYVSLIPRRTQHWILTKGSLYRKNSKPSELSLDKARVFTLFLEKHCHYFSFSGTLAFKLYE